MSCVQGQLNLSRGHFICPGMLSGIIYLSKCAALLLFIASNESPRPPGSIVIVHFHNRVLRPKLSYRDHVAPAGLAAIKTSRGVRTAVRQPMQTLLSTGSGYQLPILRSSHQCWAVVDIVSSWTEHATCIERQTQLSCDLDEIGTILNKWTGFKVGQSTQLSH